MKGTAALVALFVCSAVNASDWYWFAQTAEGSTKVYMDKQSLRRSGNKVRVWLLWNYYTMQVVPGTMFQYKSTKALNLVDCDAGTYGLRQIIYYAELDGEGTTLSSSPDISSPMMKEPPPDTIAESIVKTACGG